MDVTSFGRKAWVDGSGRAATHHAIDTGWRYARMNSHRHSHSVKLFPHESEWHMTLDCMRAGRERVRACFKSSDRCQASLLLFGRCRCVREVSKSSRECVGQLAQTRASRACWLPTGRCCCCMLLMLITALHVPRRISRMDDRVTCNHRWTRQSGMLSSQVVHISTSFKPL